MNKKIKEIVDSLDDSIKDVVKILISEFGKEDEEYKKN